MSTETTTVDNLDNFLKTFLKTPRGKTPEAIKEKLLHWLNVANTTDDATRRRTARQNVRRLAAKHPAVVTEIVATTNPEEVLR